jgi:hypothetical protein
MKVQDNIFPFLFSGKIGDCYGRIVNGKQVIVKKRSPRKSKPTTRELTARRNFAIASQFLKHIVPVVQKYDEPNGKSGFHKAMSHILRNAIRGRHPDQRIDYSQVDLGKGSLPNPGTYQVESPAKGLLEFTWTLEMMKRKLSKSDRIFVVTYCKTMHEFRSELSGPERRERQFLMDVSCFSGQQIEVWFGFSSASGALVSSSVYAGSIPVL